MQIPQTITPKKLNIDKTPRYLDEDESFFLLNHDTKNPSSLGSGADMPANYLACDMALPSGENYSVGEYYSELTNETYSWTFNSNGVNFIQRINGDGVCEIVWSGNPSCLPLSADPKHKITQFRAYMKYDKLCANRHGKALVWVDGTDTPIGMIDVEASINTNFFTTPFFDRCADDCAPLQLCVPESKDCLKGEFIPYVDSDRGKSNKMIDKGFKFMYRHVYYDQRASEYSDRSILYFQDAKGCFDNSEGFSRCMKFRLPIGGPLVDTIDFAFSEDGGLTWFKAETIEKYKKYNSTQQYWYERDLTEEVSSTFSDIDCSFDYIFCNDKQRIPISPLQVSREFNPTPREVQSLLGIKETLGFLNYKKGNCPIDKLEIDKFSISLDCLSSDTNCNVKYVKVKVRAVVYNPYFNRNALIARWKGSFGVADDKTDQASFFKPAVSVGIGTDSLFNAYGQGFNGNTRNFIVYIEGTEIWGEMEQWKSTPKFNSVKKVGVVAGVGDGGLSENAMAIEIENGNFYYQEYTFKVPQGTKGFLRLTSHHQQSGAGTVNQGTSTQVIGMIGDIHSYTGTTTLDLDALAKEIYFDTCNGVDLDISQAFIVGDFFKVSGGSNYSSAYDGYIKDKNGLAVAGARIYEAGILQTTTDYNGYYGFFKSDGTSSAISLGIRVEQSCAGDFTEIETFSSKSDKKIISSVDYVIQSTTYRDDFYAKVNVLIKNCDGNPVSGIRVAMSGDKYKVTGLNGVASFRVRNYNNRSRQIVAVLMDKNNCFTLDCSGGCNPCLPVTENTLLQACFQAKPEYNLTTITNLNTSNLLSGKKGLKKGGRYAFGVVVEGDCGKLSAVYEKSYFDISRMQETDTLSYCGFSFKDTGSNYPLWANRLKIVRSKNLNNYDLQWVVDKIERTNDGKIRLTIQSLNDYNTQYNFKTNTIYKYLQGDRVEFIRNGDGKIFDVVTNGVLNYLTLSPFNDVVISGVTNDTNYFNQILITDDGKLDTLIEGAVIELQTPSSATTEIEYFEICAAIPIVDGKLAIQSGIFTTFDTFLVNRQIAKFPVQYFESKTPSDFWGGTNLDDTGKVHFVNKYENERRYGRNITVNSQTQFNYFGDVEKTFGAKDQGDIVAASLRDDRIGLIISENDSALFQVSDGIARAGSDGVIRVATADSFISNPEAKLRGKYGCAYEDIGSVFFGDGFALYIDANSDGFIVHDYRIAKFAGEKLNRKTGQPETSCNSFFSKRIRLKADVNKTATNYLDYYRYSIGVNKNTHVIYLTLKSLRMQGVNNEKAPYIAPNDTIMYDQDSDSFLGFASFTPEGYSQLNLNNESGCSFISYQNGIPYIHPSIPDKWNEFYEIPCDHVIGVSINKEPDKVKIPISYELQSGQMFYVSSVTTDKENFLSEVPPIKVKLSNGKWNASFLNNINSTGGLYNGSRASGYSIQVVFVKDNTDELKYGTVDNNKRTQFNKVDSILFKFIVLEQSGFTENL